MALIPNLELLIISPGAARERWVALLELADEPVPLRRCVQQGVLYGVEDEDRTPIAAVLVVDLADDVAELRAVAVAEPQQGRGLGTWIVTEVCDRLRARGDAAPRRRDGELRHPAARLLPAARVPAHPRRP